jgi:methylated-DNA-protein-cysteine methyltransferase-like protein
MNDGDQPQASSTNKIISISVFIYFMLSEISCIFIINQFGDCGHLNYNEKKWSLEKTMKPYTEYVIKIIKGIPEGYVMTYGQIAKLAGSARGARQVVRILHSLSKAHELPWHRVVNAKGEVAIRDDESRFQQMLYLREEGVEVDDKGRIELDIYRFVPITK